MTDNTCHVCGSSQEVQIVPNCVLERRQPYCGECRLNLTESAEHVRTAISEYGISTALYDLTVWAGAARISFRAWYTQQLENVDR